MTSAVLATRKLVDANRAEEDSAAHSVDRARELHQRAVAGGLDGAAALIGDLGVYQAFSVPTQRMQRPDFIGAQADFRPQRLQRERPIAGAPAARRGLLRCLSVLRPRPHSLRFGPAGANGALSIIQSQIDNKIALGRITGE
jgi:hypothetical protein